jgi:SpoVK/Ycf46/Vps4 family AAA+-type ATPase
LVYEDDVKAELLEYAYTAMLFADKKVDQHIIAWNRLVLLHGPPGTGKTSLCKALAQKLSVRLGARYDSAMLVEINAHSLFSRWFSESGKLVMRMFDHVRDMTADTDALVCVLIDEVESLSAARSAAMNGSEPSDAIRVVNALLTQLDSLRAYENVLILTTSNITGAVDIAFVDRADIKRYIGPPGAAARYTILRSCLQELQRCGIIEAPAAHEGAGEDGSGALPSCHDAARTAHGAALMQAATAAEGLSGRALRKVPFQAHAYYIQAASASMDEYIRALQEAIEAAKAARAADGGNDTAME